MNVYDHIDENEPFDASPSQTLDEAYNIKLQVIRINQIKDNTKKTFNLINPKKVKRQNIDMLIMTGH